MQMPYEAGIQHDPGRPSHASSNVSLRDEIAEQPEVVRRLIRNGAGDVNDIARRLTGPFSTGQIDHILIAARGSSDHAAIYGQYLFGAKLGLTVALAAPSLLTRYGAPSRLDRALVIGISQSGSSPDVVAVLATASRQGVPTVALTNDPTSDIASAAKFVIDLRCGQEASVAATKTYTASLVAMAMLVAALGGVDPDLMRRIPDALAAAQSGPLELEARAAAERLKGTQRMLVIGRGYDYATARESALKLKELARISADPYSPADFLHGPIALAQPDLPVLAIAPAGPPADDIDDVLTRLRSVGSETIVISDRSDALTKATSPIRIPGGLPDWLQAIVTIVPAQLLAMFAAESRGHDPDAPRYLRKVTRTC